MTAPFTRVAAAVIIRGDGEVLLAQRPPGKAYAGYWEFPGGKLEPGETPRAALDRELHEELGLTVRRAAPWLVQRFAYPHAHVELHFFRVFAWEGEPVGHDGQAFAWQVPGRSTSRRCCPRTRRCCGRSRLPPVYAITHGRDYRRSGDARARAGGVRAGLRLVQVREKGWPRERQRDLAVALKRPGAAAGRRRAAERR